MQFPSSPVSNAGRSSTPTSLFVLAAFCRTRAWIATIPAAALAIRSRCSCSMSSSLSGELWLNNSSRTDASSARCFRLAGGGGGNADPGAGVSSKELLEEGELGIGDLLGGCAATGVRISAQLVSRGRDGTGARSGVEYSQSKSSQREGPSYPGRRDAATSAVRVRRSSLKVMGRRGSCTCSCSAWGAGRRDGPADRDGADAQLAPALADTRFAQVLG